MRRAWVVNRGDQIAHQVSWVPMWAATAPTNVRVRGVGPCRIERGKGVPDIVRRQLGDETPGPAAAGGWASGRDGRWRSSRPSHQVEIGQAAGLIHADPGVRELRDQRRLLGGWASAASSVRWPTGDAPLPAARTVCRMITHVQVLGLVGEGRRGSRVDTELAAEREDDLDVPGRVRMSSLYGQTADEIGAPIARASNEVSASVPGACKMPSCAKAQS